MFAHSSRRLLAAAVILLSAGAAVAAPIPRLTLFAPPDRSAPMLAPDGHAVAFVAADAFGLPQVWVRPLGGEGKEKAVTTEPNEGLSLVDWTFDSAGLVFHATYDSSGTWHSYAVEIASGHVRDLTPFRGVAGRVLGLSRRNPRDILLGISLRDPRLADVWRGEIDTGAARLSTLDPGGTLGYVADKNLNIRVFLTGNEAGGSTLATRDTETSMWRQLLVGGPDEVVRPFEFTADGKLLAIIGSPGTDTALAFERSTETGKDVILAGSGDADVDDIMQNPITGVVEAAAVSVERRRWIPIVNEVKPDLEALAKGGDPSFTVISRDAKDKLWVVAMVTDRSPTLYILWDRATKKATPLYPAAKRLDALPFVSTKPISFKARDGLALRGYLTLPAGGGKGLPMVLLVHPGPAERDNWGFDATVQWLANRGYAVLQVNYRGSAGFGRQFMQAGYREWGRKMQDDLSDGVAWAVSTGVANPKKVAIFGSGYGGYAALAGAALTPDLYAAAISDSGPVNLEALVTGVPDVPTLRNLVKMRLGDPAKDRERLAQVSPVNLADRVKAAVLVGQAARDERANPAETERFARALEKRNGRVTYVVYEDAQGGINQPADRLDFYARVEDFLARTLGGQAEPIGGERVKGSSASVKISRN
jgi:dipeptidyl aminopeptidase/acylaminoacyl peptidase